MTAKDQLNLFATAPADTGSGVEPCAHEPEVYSLGEALPCELYMGTSSWAFPGWEGLLYGARHTNAVLSRHGLKAYSAHPLMKAVGIDRSYYGPVSIDEFRGYAELVPEDFHFLVKGAQRVTSPVKSGAERELNPDFMNATWATDYVVRPYVEGLGPKAGVLLFQLPPLPPGTFPAPEVFADKLYGFLSKLPKGARYAVEIRNAALFTSRYAEALKASGVTHCYNVHPTMPSLTRQTSLIPPSSGPLVIRWMLREGMSFEQARQRYAPFNAIMDHDLDTRIHLVRMIDEMSTAGGRVMLIVNNKAEGCSPMSILELARAWVTR